MGDVITLRPRKYGFARMDKITLLDHVALYQEQVKLEGMFPELRDKGIELYSALMNVAETEECINMCNLYIKQLRGVYGQM